MNGFGKNNEESVPLEDKEEKDFREELSRTKSLRRSLGQSFITSGKKSSFFSAVSTIYSTAMGAGALSLPILVSKFGFVIGVLLIIFCGWLAVFSAKLLQRARILSGKSDMSILSVHCFGRAGSIYSRLVLICFCQGMTIAYIIVMCTTIEKIIKTAYGHYNTTFFTYKFVLYIYAIICVIIVSPFAFAKSMERLRFVSYINIASSIVYLIISIIGAAKTVHRDATPKLYYGPPADFKIQEAFTAFGCIFVAYAIQQNFFPIYKSLSNPNDNRMMNVVWAGLVVVIILYIITACTAYISFGGIINGDVLDNYQTITTGQGGYYCLLFSYGLLTLCGMPMLFYGGRDPLLHTIKDAIDLFSKKKSSDNNEELIEDPEAPKELKKLSLKFYFIGTGIIYAVCCVIGITVTNLELVISILGCICGNSITYILPGGYIWYLEDKSRFYRLSGIIITIFGIFSMIISLIGIIWNEISG